MTHLRLERSAAARPAPGREGSSATPSRRWPASPSACFRDLGLTSGFARLVVFLGHGSNSLNNPHNSAYNCGACAGTAGGAQRPRHRPDRSTTRASATCLAQRGLAVPRRDRLRRRLPQHLQRLGHLLRPRPPARLAPARLRAVRADARAGLRPQRPRALPAVPVGPAGHDVRRRPGGTSRSAPRTCRRPGPSAATRPTPCASSAGAAGRGACSSTAAPSSTPTTRPRTTPSSSILTRTLQAAVPVCAGISLEYYFSYVDSAGWGCGTKLPHNVASLLGVMNGAASDLRTGLPWQMVEIHEPVRLLFVIETTPEAMLRIMDRNPGDRPALSATAGSTWPRSTRTRRASTSSATAGSSSTSAEPVDLPRVASWRRLVSRLARPPGVRAARPRGAVASTSPRLEARPTDSERLAGQPPVPPPPERNHASHRNLFAFETLTRIWG